MKDRLTNMEPSAAELSPVSQEHPKKNLEVVEGEIQGWRVDPDIKNGDRSFVYFDSNFYGVCDGGMENPGAEASDKTETYLWNQIHDLTLRGMIAGKSPEDQIVLIKDLLKKADKNLVDSNKDLPDEEKQRTTALICHIWEGPEGEKKLIIGSAGDSRVYLLRDGKLEALTVDDTELKDKEASLAKVTQAKFDSIQSESQLSEEEKNQYKEFHNEPSNRLGDGNIKPEIYTQDLQEGDRIFITSDGIPDNLTTEEILKYLSQYPPGNPRAASNNVLDHAIRRLEKLGTAETHFRARKDNMSCLAIDIVSASAGSTSGVEPPGPSAPATAPVEGEEPEDFKAAPASPSGTPAAPSSPAETPTAPAKPAESAASAVVTTHEMPKRTGDEVVEIPYPEHVTGIELPEDMAKEESLVEALNLFDAGYSIYMAKDAASMSPEELAKRAQVKGIIEKIKENQEGLFYTNKFKGKDATGKTKSFQVREYLPTDDIIVFLTTEIAREELPLTTRENYWKIKYLLEKVSKPSGINKISNSTKYVARLDQEIQFVQRNNLASNETEELDKASTRLHGRYDMRITKRSKRITQIKVPASPFSVAPLFGTGAPSEPVPSTGPSTMQPSEPVPAPTVISEEAPSSIPAPTPAPTSEPIIPGPPEPPISAPVQSAENGMGEPIPAPVQNSVEDDGTELDAAPVTPTIEDLRHDFHFVNRTEDVKKRAREIAELQLREELRRGKWYNPKDWFRKMKIRVAEEYYRQQYTERAREAMIQNNNSYLQMDVVKNAAIDARHKIEEERRAGVAKAQAVAEIHKLGMDFEGQKTEEANAAAHTLFMDHLIRPAVASLNGLTTADLNGLSDMQNVHRGRIMGEIQEKMRTWIAATYDKRTLQGITDPRVKAALQDPTVVAQLQEFFGKKSTKYGIVADYFASDIVDMAQQIQRDSRAHNFAVDTILNKSKIVLGRMSWAAETEAKLSATDRAVSWAQSHRVTGVVLNPATIGAAVSVGTYGLTRGSAALGRVANIVAPGAGGLAGGIFAGIRRGMDLKKDRAAHQVEMTYGAVPETRADVDQRLSAANLNFVQRRLAEAAGAYRRADLERFSYDSKSAGDLVGAVDALKGDLTQVANRENLAKSIAEIKARLDYSSVASVDLITFEGREAVEQQRLSLIKSIAEGRVALRRAGMPDSEINARIASEHGDFLKQFEGNVSSQDKSFRRYRTVQSLKATGRGALVGVGVAAAGQSVAWGANQVLHRIYDNADQSIVDVIGPGHTAQEYTQASHGVDFIAKSHLSGLYTDTTKPHVVNLTDELAVKIQPNHEVRFLNTHIGFEHYDVDAARLNPDGSITLHGPLTEEIKTQLHEAHFQINEATSQITNEVVVPKHADFTTGFPTQIPDGTEWVKDTHGWDLVVSSDKSQILVNDAVFSQHGTIEHWDSANSLLHTINQGSYEHTVHEVLNARGEWKEGVNLDRYEWYSYNQPGSQLNELKLFNYKMGDTVRLSMHNMRDSWQNGLNPERVNVPTVYEGLDVQGGKAGFAFSLPGHLKEPMIALTDKNGYLDLNPQDHDPSHLLFFVDPKGEVKSMPLGDFSRMVLNYDAYKDLPDGGLATELRHRYDVFNVGGPNGEFGFISAGRYVEENGQKVWQSFATIRGTETPQVSGGSFSETLIKPPSIDRLITDHTIVDSTTISPPILENIPQPPPVAVPFVPRYPLQELFGTEAHVISQTVANEASADLGTAAAIVDTASQRETPRNLQYKKQTNAEGKVTLVDHEGRPIKRDTERERKVVSEYISNIKRVSPEYHAELTKLLPKMGNMSNKTRVVVNIPADSEDTDIIKILGEYIAQIDTEKVPLDPELFQINIIVNKYIDKYKQGNLGEKVDKFIENAYQATGGKRFTIKLIEPEPESEFKSIGEMRKLITDLTLMSSLNRDHQNGSLYIFSEAAFLKHVEKHSIQEIMETMDKNPQYDVAYGRLDLAAGDEIVENDLLLLQYVLSAQQENIMRSLRDEIKPDMWNSGDTYAKGGGNAIFSAEAYALAGGYDATLKLDENKSLGAKIAQMRGETGAPNSYVIGDINANRWSSPVLFINEIGQSIPDSDEHNESEKGDQNDQISKKLSRYVRINESNRDIFEAAINNEFQTLQNALNVPQKATGMMNDILTKLGFEAGDYAFEGNIIKIKNWEHLMAKFGELRNKNEVDKEKRRQRA